MIQHLVIAELQKRLAASPAIARRGRANLESVEGRGFQVDFTLDVFTETSVE